MASWMNESGEQIDSPAMPIVDNPDVLDRVCLNYVRMGGTTKYLAKYFHVNKRTIERNIERARLHESGGRDAHADPKVEPLFGCNPYEPGSPCYHPDPIPHGKHEYCPQCHKTGIEAHPALRRRPGDVTSEPRSVPRPDDGLSGGMDGTAAKKRQHASA